MTWALSSAPMGLGGLFVAIPAAILAHFFEARIRNLFHEIDELLFSLMPQVERYEGRLRVSRQHLAGGDDGGEKQPPAPPPAEARVPASTPK
jgi:biopolymer transport protein ExbB